jgi:hypothetical protein
MMLLIIKHNTFAGQCLLKKEKGNILFICQMAFSALVSGGRLCPSRRRYDDFVGLVAL